MSCIYSDGPSEKEKIWTPVDPDDETVLTEADKEEEAEDEASGGGYRGRRRGDSRGYGGGGRDRRGGDRRGGGGGPEVLKTPQ